MKIKDFRARISAMMGEHQAIVTEAGEISRYLARRYARDGEARAMVSRGAGAIRELKKILICHESLSDTEECTPYTQDLLARRESTLQGHYETLAHLRHLKRQA